MALKLSEISLRDIVKTVWPDIHVGISAKCLLPSLWHLFASRRLKVQREEGKRIINLCPWHSNLNCTETVPRIVTFFSQEFFFLFQLYNKHSSWNQLLSFNEYYNQKEFVLIKKRVLKKAWFYFCWFDNIDHPRLNESKNTFWIFRGKKGFFLFRNEKNIPMMAKDSLLGCYCNRSGQWGFPL